MADIVLRLRIDDKDYDAKIINADQQLKKLRGSTDAVVKSTGVIGTTGKRDFQMLAQQVLYSSDITGKYSGILSNLATGLMTGGFIGAAFAGFAALINSISEESKDAVEEVKKFQGAVEQLINIQTIKGSFQILAEDIPEAIETLKANIGPMMELTQDMSLEEIKRRQDLNTAQVETNFSMYQAITVLEEMKKKYEELDRAKNVLTKAGLIYTLEETKKATDELIKEDKKLLDEKSKNLKTEITQFRTAQELFDYYTNRTYSNYREKRWAELELAEQIAKQKEDLAAQTSEAEMQNADQTLGYLAAGYAQHTAVFKAASAAQALINTYSAAQAALAPPPLGLGPILGPALAALVVAGGLARVASILSTEIPGYAKGGIVVGEKGPEVIAPMQDYAEGQALLVAKTVAALQGGMRGVGVSGNVEKKLDQVIMAFQQKQFRIRYDDLYTANDKSARITSELEF